MIGSITNSQIVRVRVCTRRTDFKSNNVFWVRFLFSCKFFFFPQNIDMICSPLNYFVIEKDGRVCYDVYYYLS